MPGGPMSGLDRLAAARGAARRRRDMASSESLPDRADSTDTKTAALMTEALCTIQFPRLDEFRTYCYEHEISIPANVLALAAS